MTRALDIAIVGYGIAGISAAIYLRRAGHRITHFERNDPPVVGGAGMLMHPAAMRQLDRLGILAGALECGARVRRIRAQNEQGRSLMDFHYSDAIDGQFGLGIQRGALHRLLSGADPGRGQLLAGRKVVAVEPETGCLTEERGERHGPFDLVVIADGAHSLLRRQVAGPAQEGGARSAALVGLFDDPQDIAGESLSQYFVATRHLSIWPVGRATPGEPSRCAIAISASLAEAEAIRDQHQWRALCTQFWPGLRALVNDVDNTSLRAISYREVEISQPCAGRVVLIGDAAHAMSPQLGTGAQLALEDAAALSSALGRYPEVSRALRAFRQTRMPQVRRHHFISRWLTPLFQSDSATLGFLRDRVFASMMNSSSARRLAQELFS